MKGQVSIAALYRGWLATHAEPSMAKLSAVEARNLQIRFRCKSASKSRPLPSEVATSCQLGTNPSLE